MGARYPMELPLLRDNVNFILRRPITAAVAVEVRRVARSLGFGNRLVNSIVHEVEVGLVQQRHRNVVQSLADHLCHCLLNQVTAEQFLCDLPVLLWRLCDILLAAGLIADHSPRALRIQVGECYSSSMSQAFVCCLGSASPESSALVHRLYFDVYRLGMLHGMKPALCFCLAWHCGFCVLLHVTERRGQFTNMKNIMRAVARAFIQKINLDPRPAMVRYHLFEAMLGRWLEKPQHRRLLSNRDRALFCSYASPTKSWWKSRMLLAAKLEKTPSIVDHPNYQ